LTGSSVHDLISRHLAENSRQSALYEAVRIGFRDDAEACDIATAQCITIHLTSRGAQAQGARRAAIGMKAAVTKVIVKRN
jgi:hypothetical protein